MNVRKLFAVSTVIASLSIASLVWAQQEQARRGEKAQVQVQVQPGQPARQPQHMMSTDQKLATCLAIANQEEISVAKFVEDKAKNKDVKDFAEMLVKDHESYLKKLAQFAPEASSAGYLDSQPATRPGAARTQTNNQPANNANPPNAIQQTGATQEPDGQHLDFVQLHREIAVECVRLAKESISKKDEKEIDKCFIGHQIARHGEMKTKLIVFERHATGNLKQIISEGLETTEKHLKQAENIMKKLDNPDSSVTSRDRKD